MKQKQGIERAAGAGQGGEGGRGGKITRDEEIGGQGKNVYEEEETAGAWLEKENMRRMTGKRRMTMKGSRGRGREGQEEGREANG